MQTSSGHFYCDACQRRYTWTASIAGRTVRCKCGHVMTAPVFRPDATNSDSDDDLYDVVPDDPPIRVAHPVAVVASKPVSYARQSAVSSDSAVERLFPDRV